MLSRFSRALPKHTGLSSFASICNSNVVSINSFNFYVLMLQLEYLTIAFSYIRKNKANTCQVKH